MSKTVHYLTTNTLKFSNAKRYFDSLDGIKLVQHTFDTPEIQNDSCEEIAKEAAIFAAKIIGEPCIKLDVGFYIPSLGGFPGPFVKYINDWLSVHDILAMLADKEDRSAYFIDATAIGFPDGTSKVLSKKYTGRIAQRGKHAPSDWPIDALFIPDGHNIPLASMSNVQQSEYWSDGAWPLVVEYLEQSQI